MQNMQRKTIKIRFEQRIDIDWQMGGCIALFYVCNALNLFVQKCIGGSAGSYMGLLIQGIMIAGIAFNIRNLLYRAGKIFVLAEAIACMAFAVSFLIGEADFSVLLYNMVWLVGVCIPMGLIVWCMDKDILNDILEKISKPLIVILVGIYILEFIVFPTGNVLYEMSVSYAIAFPIIILCNSIFENMSIVNCIWAAAAILMNLLYGCRGSTICILAFLGIKVLFGLKNHVIKIYVWLLAIAAMAGLVIGFFFVKDMIYDMISSGRINAFRSIETILHHGLFYGSGRGELFAFFGEQILDNPIIGWGICGKWPDGGNYPHNIILEFLVSFGVIIGGMITAALVVIVMKALEKRPGTEKNMFLVYLALNVQLLVSGTFLQSTSFFICMALAAGMLKNMPRMREYDEFKKI